MAPELQMPSPVCLIENEEGQLKVNQEALEILDSIKEPVIVVAIVGLYRTGKSYLMNRLAGKKSGFSLGSTVQSLTKGIWMWCVPHPNKPNHTLVLLDTEGLGNVEKGSSKNDTWIFSLAVLLSSTFVYNSKGTIDQQAMDQLHYVTELTNCIKSKSAVSIDTIENSSEFVSFFPNFIWTVRDFTLDLIVGGKPITSDEYLEMALKLNKGKAEAVEKYNLPRRCIRQFFPKRKCFVFNMPNHRKKLYQLEHLHDDELDPEFVEQAQSFCSYIFQNSNVKTVHGGIIITGSRLKSLVLTYVETITCGDIPCLENAVLTLAQIENSAAVQRALAHYEETMKQRVQFPTETLQELLVMHATCERKAIEVFMKDSFKDVDYKFQKELASLLEIKRDAFCDQNMYTSEQVCKALIQDVFSPLEKAVQEGAFSKPGGYQLFQEKIKELKEKYYQQPRKGIQAEETLQEYLKSKEDVVDTILWADHTLSKKEKEIEVERVKAQGAEAAAKKLEEMRKKNQEMMEQKEKSYQEHTKQVTEKMEAEIKQLIVEQERAMQCKLDEQVKLLKEGFHKEAQQLHQQIKSLQNKMNQNNTCHCSIF